MAFKTDCLIIDITMGNAAFEERGAEVARILKRLAWQAENGTALEAGHGGHLFDRNGNCCGHFKVIERRER